MLLTKPTERRVTLVKPSCCPPCKQDKQPALDLEISRRQESGGDRGPLAPFLSGILIARSLFILILGPETLGDYAMIQDPKGFARPKFTGLLTSLSPDS